MSHAVLSPSGADRWLNCTPSARLEQQFPDRAGQAAEEGTLAHALGELLIRYKLQRIKKYVFEEELAKIRLHRLFDNAMEEHADDYALYVLEQFAEARAKTKDAILFTEQKLDLTEYVPEGFGTSDIVIIADGLMNVIDLKYGKGVPVSAVGNRQMRLYALGALEAFKHIYDINEVSMTIYQPRLDSISVWKLPVDEVMTWGTNELKPLARLAFDGQGDFTPGKHCQFCKARAVCRAFADHNLVIAKHEFKAPDLLRDEEVSDIMDRAKVFQNWLTSVEDYALDQAVNNGKQWPGYKVVEGRSNRKYSDEQLALKALADQDPDKVAPRSILGITAMEKLIGKKLFEERLTPLIIKPAGKPTLTPLSDKRAPINSLETAKADFQ
jgi:uncharacterized protein DUF2800